MEKILNKFKSGFGALVCCILPFAGLLVSDVALAITNESFLSGAYIETTPIAPAGVGVTVDVSCTDENGSQPTSFSLPLVVGANDGQVKNEPFTFSWDSDVGTGGTDGVGFTCEATLTGEGVSQISSSNNMYTDLSGTTYELTDTKKDAADRKIDFGKLSVARSDSGSEFFKVKITAPTDYTFTVKKFVTPDPDYDNRFGPLSAINFDLKVVCADGSVYEPTSGLQDGGSYKFDIPATQSNMDCKISEDLGPMAGYFKVKYGDSFGPHNGRMKGVTGKAAASNSAACGESSTPGTFCVRNTYVPNQTNAFNVSKTASSDADTEPFQIEISCKNGDAYSFGLEPGEVGTFFYPRGEPIDCEVTEPSKEEGADTSFTVKKGDTFSAHNGRMLGASNQAAASSGSACGETYSEATFCVRNIKAQDLDGDGLSDAEEAALGTNPNDPDTDGDGLPDGLEVDGYGTNPNNRDTDGDGVTDGAEVDSAVAGGSEISARYNPLLSPANIPVFSPIGMLAVLMGLMWFGRRRLK